MLTFKLNGDSHFGTGVASGDIAGASSHAANRRRGANGRDESLGFFGELEVLAPGMEFFGCHHDRLPQAQLQSAHMSLSGASIPEIAEKYDGFDPFLGVPAKYLAQKKRNVVKEADDEWEKRELRCHAVLYGREMLLKADGIVAGYLADRLFNPSNDTCSGTS
jgi:hypothetical protein